MKRELIKAVSVVLMLSTTFVLVSCKNRDDEDKSAKSTKETQIEDVVDEHKDITTNVSDEVKEIIDESKQQVTPDDNEQTGINQIVFSSEGSDINYIYDVVYNEDSHTLEGTMSIEVTNRSGEAWEDFVLEDWTTCEYFNDIRQGKESTFTNAKLTMGDEISDVTFERGEELSSLWIKLPNPLEDGSNLILNADFVIYIPEDQGRFGYFDEGDEHTVLMGNALPVVGLYKNGAWQTHPYVVEGESFNSEVASYDVTFECPVGYEVVMTGIPSYDEETNKYHCVVSDIRDFTIMMSTAYETISEMHGDVLLTIFYESGSPNAELSMEYTKDIIDFLESKIGPYPYDSLDVCVINIDNGLGMEYAELVLIDEESITISPNVLVHEMAHEWFYLLIGNDEYLEPWIDEGFATFYEHYYLWDEEIYSDDVYFEFYIFEQNEFGTEMSLNIVADDPKYGISPYWWGGSFLGELFLRMGEEKFEDAIARIYETYVFDIADTEGILEIFRSSTDKNIEDLIDKYFI